MKIPKEIKIGYKTYSIEEAEPDEGKLYLDGELCYGTISYNEDVIRLNKNYPGHQGVTLIHEVLHGICDMQGLRTLNDDEESIDRLAKGIYQLIIDNNIKIKYK